MLGDQALRGHPPPRVLQQFPHLCPGRAGHAHEDPRVVAVVVVDGEDSGLRAEQVLALERIGPEKDQLAAGYAKMRADGGLTMFVPDFDDIR